jgi:hypothetical protein
VIVVQVSSDPETVAALQQHASEVSDLVQGGMMAMRAAMMKNGMHAGMMGNPPKGETPEQSAGAPLELHQQSSALSSGKLFRIWSVRPPELSLLQKGRCKLYCEEHISLERQCLDGWKRPCQRRQLRTASL